MNYDWQLNKEDKLVEVEFWFVSGTVLVPVKFYVDTFFPAVSFSSLSFPYACVIF